MTQSVVTDERYAPADMPSGAVQRRLPASLREHGPFRLLFWGQALSVMGDRITPVAIAFAVLGLGSATDLGVVLAAGGIPFALFALAGGVWADRVGRRKVMLASDIVRAVSQTATAVLLLTGTAEVWMLAVLAFVYGTAAALFMPALIGLIPQTVRQARLQEANALLSLTRSIASVAGPALAGVLVVAAGSGEAIAVDAATFAFSALCLARMRIGEEAPAADARAVPRRAARRLERGALARLAALGADRDEHLPRVRAARGVRARPGLAEDRLDGASSWAAIVACFGIGGVLGNVLAMRIPLRRPVFIAALALVGASTQAAIIGSGLGTVGIAALELAGRRLRGALLHPLGPQHPGADPEPPRLARQRLRLQRLDGPHAAGHGGLRADRRCHRPAADAAGHERDRPRSARWPGWHSRRCAACAARSPMCPRRTGRSRVPRGRSRRCRSSAPAGGSAPPRRPRHPRRRASGAARGTGAPAPRRP